MGPDATRPRRRFAGLGVVRSLFWAAAFAAACGQAPLYYSNQNQYFLHGLADAGVGLLHEDWLANTLDPTPLFSALVAFTARHLHPWAFYLYYALLLGVYAAAMLGLFVAVVGGRWPPAAGRSSSPCSWPSMRPWSAGVRTACWTRTTPGIC